MTLTPAQQQGFEIGKLYRVVGSDSTLEKGSIVMFDDDDYSYVPRFEYVEGQDNYKVGSKFYLDLENLEPYNPDTPETTYTNKKLSNQEILLMYIKQHYPEDRVMIAMVENL